MVYDIFRTTMFLAPRAQRPPMIRILYLAALLAAVAPPSLAAQDDEAFCPDGRTQLDMNRCAAQALARADTLLNENYQQVMRMIGPERVQALRTAQRAWIQFRDAECAFRESEVAGGSMAPMVHALCLARQTEARAVQFGEIVAGGDT